jgi:uncharacterized membrane protein YbhN (UPF0104 family)
MNDSPATEVHRAIAEPPSRRPHPYFSFLVKAGIGIAIIAFLIWHFDARPALDVLAHERPGFFAATFALYVAGQVMSTYRWRLLAGIVGLKVRFRELLAYYFVGMFTNLFVPGLVGGDAARAFYLGRHHHRMPEAIACTVADRGYGLVALFWFAAATAILFNDGVLPSSVIAPIVGVGAVVLAGYLASPLIARFARFGPRLLRRAVGAVAPYLHNPSWGLPAIGLSVILQASLAVCQYLLALGLGLKMPLGLFMLVVPVANVFASLPITLNGLGVRETTYLMLFGMAGVSRADAIALGLLWFLATMLGGLLGAIPFATLRLPAIKPGKAEIAA